MGENIFMDGGKTGEVIRQKDWSQTSLKSIEQWPPLFQSNLEYTLSSGLPMILFWGPEQLFFYNDAFHSLSGQDMIPGQPLCNLPDGRWKSFSDIFQPLLNEIFSSNHTLNKKDVTLPVIRNGKLRYITLQISLSSVRENGAVAGVIGTCIETNPYSTSGDRKMLVEGQDTTDHTFRLLADSMPQLVWTSGPDGELNYFNQAVYNYTGLTKEEMFAGGWLMIVHPSEREENIRLWKEAVETGKDFLFEHRFRRNDGAYRWQLSRAIPQRDDRGNIEMWVGTSTDIQAQKMFTQVLEEEVRERTKELKKINDELSKSEERYHLMVDEVQDYAILFLKRDGTVENWNKGAEKIKQYKSEEIVGRNFSTFYTPEDRASNLPQTLLRQAMLTGKASQEGWRVRKDGTYFWASVVITALHDQDQQIIGFSKVTRDLTDKKYAEDQLRESAIQIAEKNKELEKMNADLQSFAYVSSHDLQEPLRKIQTFVTRIVEKEIDNISPGGKNYFTRIQEAALRMQILIEDLLNYSRTNTNDRVFEKTNINDIVDEVIAELQELTIDKKATITRGELCTINAIKFQVRQLLNNLINNSLKFSRPGIPPEIRIESEIIQGSACGCKELIATRKYCKLTVTDNGIGFDPLYKDRIFEVFQRLHRKDQYKGTGIGLAIVKKIVDNHNGAICASSEENHGAKFDIYLPV